MGLLVNVTNGRTVDGSVGVCPFDNSLDVLDDLENGSKPLTSGLAVVVNVDFAVAVIDGKKLIVDLGLYAVVNTGLLVVEIR